jgi:prepilin-type N-terminal cleavage/methylation domain-containing protein
MKKRMSMNFARQRGVTLIEMIIVLAISGIIMAPIAAAFYQFIYLPTLQADKLTTISDLRNATVWLTEDSRSAQLFTPSCSPDYGTFNWTDYTASPPKTYAARYYYADGSLYRELSEDEQVVSTISIARHIENYDDIRFTVTGALLIVEIKSTIESIRGPVSTEDIIRIRPRSGAFARAWAIFAGQESPEPDKIIHWSGSDSTVTGNIHSNSDIHISGSNNQVSGLAEAHLTFGGGGEDNTFGQKVEGADILPMPLNCGLTNYFQPYTFSWAGDVNLNTIDEVWEDYPQKKKLKPGVYYATGKIQLPGNDVSGNVTLIGDKVHVAGSESSLTAYTNGVVIYATGTGSEAIKISGDEGTFSGVIYAANGLVDISGSDVTVDGSIIGLQVKLTGSELNISYQTMLTSIWPPKTSAEVTPPPPPVVTIASDDFESGDWEGGSGWLDEWYHSGDARIRSDGDSYEGSYHLRLRRGNGYVDRAVDLSGQTNVRLQFWAKVDSFEGGDTAQALVSPDDTNWTTVKTWTASSDDDYHFVDIDLSGFTMTGEFWIAFDAEMSGRGDRLYIDDLQIVGQ